jgi:hypothetical protein
MWGGQGPSRTVEPRGKKNYVYSVLLRVILGILSNTFNIPSFFRVRDHILHLCKTEICTLSLLFCKMIRSTTHNPAIKIINAVCPALTSLRISLITNPFLSTKFCVIYLYNRQLLVGDRSSMAHYLPVLLSWPTMYMYFCHGLLCTCTSVMAYYVYVLLLLPTMYM